MARTYWRISPEVAGELADGTEIDTSVHPPQVRRLHHRFEGWLGDDIIECFPCFLITDRLANLLKTSGLTGFDLGQVDVSRSANFDEMYPNRRLPEFLWLNVTGVEQDDADFRLTQDHRLEVSDAALVLLRKARLEHADLEKA